MGLLRYIRNILYSRSIYDLHNTMGLGVLDFGSLLGPL